MELNLRELKKIAKASPTAEIVATSFAMRERLTHNSNIPRYRTQLVMSGEKIEKDDYMKFWKDLEAVGAGKIIYGRGRNPNRFEWHYNLKDVGQAAVDGLKRDVEKIDVKKPGKRKRRQQAMPQTFVEEKSEIEVNEPKVEPKVQMESYTKYIFIPLRTDFTLELALPGDLSQDEVELIIKAIKRVSA